MDEAMTRSAYVTVAVSRQLWWEGPRSFWRRDLRKRRDETLRELAIEVSGPSVVVCVPSSSVLEFTWFWGPARLRLLERIRLDQVPPRRWRPPQTAPDASLRRTVEFDTLNSRASDS
jgi:hypothetical protein